MRNNIDIFDKNGKHYTQEEYKKHMSLNGLTELDMPETADDGTNKVDE